MSDESQSAARPVTMLRFSWSLIRYFWPAVLGVLPYPDPVRRARMRQKARQLVTRGPWLKDDEMIGSDAAQLAMTRLLWLQRRVRRATWVRQRDEAAILARAALETCIVGLYCLHSGDAVTRLTAANIRAAGRVVSFLTTQDLVSKAAIDSAVGSLGDQGRDPDLRRWAEWLERERNFHVIELYRAYYVPLSHFFVHTNSFTLGRHVRPDARLRRRPAHPWNKRSAAHLADTCAGVLAMAIADQAGTRSEYYARYADPHVKRMLAPAIVMAAKGWRQSVQLRDIPGMFTALRDLRRYANGPGRSDAPELQQDKVKEFFTRTLGPIIRNTPDGMLRQAADEFIIKLIADMNAEPRRTPTEGTRDPDGTPEAEPSG